MNNKEMIPELCERKEYLLTLELLFKEFNKLFSKDAPEDFNTANFILDTMAVSNLTKSVSDEFFGSLFNFKTLINNFHETTNMRLISFIDRAFTAKDLTLLNRVFYSSIDEFYNDYSKERFVASCYECGRLYLFSFVDGYIKAFVFNGDEFWLYNVDMTVGDEERDYFLRLSKCLPLIYGYKNEYPEDLLKLLATDDSSVCKTFNKLCELYPVLAMAPQYQNGVLIEN